MKPFRPLYLRIASGAISLGSTIVAISSAWTFAQAQSGIVDIVPAIVLSTPGGGDVMPDVRIDPFTDTVDGAMASARRGGAAGVPGAAVGTPDIAYGASDPVDSSVGGSVAGPLGRVLPARAGGAMSELRNGGRGSGRRDGKVNQPIFIGRISGVPPVAVLRLADGSEVVASVGDFVQGIQVHEITADFVALANGRILRFTPIASGGAGGIAGVDLAGGAMFGPHGSGAPINLVPGAISGGPGGTDLPDHGSGGPVQVQGGGTSGGGLAGGPDAENVGHMPLAPAIPGIGSPQAPATSTNNNGGSSR